MKGSNRGRRLHDTRARAFGWALGGLVLCAGCYDGAAGDPEPGVETDGEEGGGPPTSEAPIGGGVALACDPGAREVGAPIVRRLTRREYNAAVADLVGDASSPADGFQPESVSRFGFSNLADALRVDEVEAFEYQSAAESLSVATAEQRFTAVFPCEPGEAESDECIEQFVTRFGRRAFRRPLDDEERARYRELYRAGIDAYGERGGVRVVLAAMLQSPFFLYRTELGGGAPDEQGRRRLDPYEIASALSFSLLGTTPDDAMLDEAGRGAFDTDEEVEAYATALLEDPRARRGAVEFYRQMFGFDELLGADKDVEMFPDYPSLRGSMAREVEVFVGDVLFDADRRLETLLTADYSFLDEGLAALYGVEYSGTPFGRTALTGSDRAGILTMPGTMAAFAATQNPSIAKRGEFVRARLLCQEIPEPPPNAFDGLPEPDDAETLREYIEQVTEPEGCQACHALINDPGFAFDGFDAIGGRREGFDVSGELTSTRDIDGPFDGPAELAGRLARSEQVRECMAIQHFRWALGREVSQADACSIVDAYERFVEADGDLLELAIATVSSEAFLYRAAQ